MVVVVVVVVVVVAVLPNGGRYRGWVERGIPSDHGVCEFGESRRLYSAATHTTEEVPQFRVEGTWLGGRPVGRQSVVQERIFPAAPPPAKAKHGFEGLRDKRTPEQKKKEEEAEAEKRRKEKERAARAVLLFNFQVGG